jgi:hypothetical protein
MIPYVIQLGVLQARSHVQQAIPGTSIKNAYAHLKRGRISRPHVAS